MSSVSNSKQSLPAGAFLSSWTQITAAPAAAGRPGWEMSNTNKRMLGILTKHATQQVLSLLLSLISHCHLLFKMLILSVNAG